MIVDDKHSSSYCRRIIEYEKGYNIDTWGEHYKTLFVRNLLISVLS
jgi:hypothetical protein